MERRRNLLQAKSILWLAAALVMTMTWAVGATGWTRQLNIVTLVGLGVILIGVMLARSILPAVIAHLFSLIIGLAWTFWVTSRLLPQHYTWLERWENLVIRLNSWYFNAIQGGTSYDNLMFILQMGVIVWGTGYLTIWFLFRSGRVWQAVMPGGLVLLINLYYAPRDITVWFLVYLMLALLLAIRFNLASQEIKWRNEGVFFRPDISFDFLRAGFIFSVLVISLAWLLPPAVDAKSLRLFEEFQGSWYDFQQEWNRLYADLNYRTVGTASAFGKTLSLGGPRRLTDEPVMDVNVEGGIGRYWRAAVYDEYTGFGWRSNDEDTASFGPEEPLSLAVFEERQVITQTYTMHRNGVLMLYAMGSPIALSHSARVTFAALSDEQATLAPVLGWLGQSSPWIEDITYIRSDIILNEGESYRVVSAGSMATINQLQSAGGDYPAWITERYLQLPDTITQRTRDLALELAEPFDNAYDKARTIESFLRNELRYNEQMAVPPPEVDRVDYVLFEGKEAYCDYYASSMIVMLRSLGIPARLAAGFARGEYDPELNAFRVVSADAHSWVEVYFPHYGWIEFEPTSAQPGIFRAPSAESAAPFSSEDLSEPAVPEMDRTLQERSNIPIDQEAGAPDGLTIPWFGGEINLPGVVLDWRSIGTGGLLLAALAGVSAWLWRLWTAPISSILKLYQRMLRVAGWMGLAIRPWQTPFEHAAVLQHTIPSRQREVEIITSQYVYQTFGHPSRAVVEPLAEITGAGETDGRTVEPVTDPEGQDYNLAWHKLQPEMVKVVIKQHLSAPWHWLRSRR